MQDSADTGGELLILPASLYWLFVFVDFDQLFLFFLSLHSYRLFLQCLDVSFFDSLVCIEDLGTDV